MSITHHTQYVFHCDRCKCRVEITGGYQIPDPPSDWTSYPDGHLCPTCAEAALRDDEQSWRQPHARLALAVDSLNRLVYDLRHEHPRAGLLVTADGRVALLEDANRPDLIAAVAFLSNLSLPIRHR